MKHIKSLAINAIVLATVACEVFAVVAAAKMGLSLEPISVSCALCCLILMATAPVAAVSASYMLKPELFRDR